ncbi:N,N-dimethylformamidase beta subunit family domain-containing protein [Devosia sp. 1566]|uniref:N,N-dimethylformamidase beta subunit family domain-containing protein n=1 Tax=Devosia sp. 1566 TaxID=2499144 RepID=UPI000FD7CF34|nr:N,N-dimethylformamidase beta subunit family domain-containing protein [Devosia sp. 1566]
MRRTIDHAAMAVTGYVEPWTGDAARQRLVSCSSRSPVEAVRIRALDRDDLPELDWPVKRLQEVKHCSFSQGSWLSIEAPAAVTALSFELLLTRNSGRRVLLDTGSFALLIEDNDRLIYQAPGVETQIGTLPTNQWLKVEFAAGTLAITALHRFSPFTLSCELAAQTPQRLIFCSDSGEALPTLNCRLANIAVTTESDRANWTFPTLFTAEPLPAGDLQLTLHNNPTFCVRSARWDGSSLDPRLTPSHYDAIHFHDTDMAGLEWSANFAIDIPADARSGVYAVELVTAGGEIERLPFFVSAQQAQSRLLFVAPTATYLAYADEFLPPHLYEWIGTDRGHAFARANNLRSLYDYHSDASGVSLASTRRPKATLRDDYVYPLCGAPHLLPVDLHFLRFAARNGIAFDLTTDHDLHRDGAGLLARYKGVVTGSHPEYLSVAMEEAYRTYVAGGGRLAYMGGNGFAAAVAFKDNLMELRRGPTQPGRTWDGPLAEMPLALTNEPGGYLRDRGRGEFSLTGVGIALMGFSKALPFTRAPASHDEAFAWLFDGVIGENFGDTGMVLGGAAGYEVDNTNWLLGTPDGIVVLATASGFSEDYVDDPGRWYEGGSPEREARRLAEMTYLPHPSGGAVFSASSVCFLGALPGPDDQNDVGRITTNLLLHFAS